MRTTTNCVTGADVVTVVPVNGFPVMWPQQLWAESAAVWIFFVLSVRSSFSYTLCYPLVKQDNVRCYFLCRFCCCCCWWCCRCLKCVFTYLSLTKSILFVKTCRSNEANNTSNATKWGWQVENTWLHLWTDHQHRSHYHHQASFTPTTNDQFNRRHASI